MHLKDKSNGKGYLVINEFLLFRSCNKLFLFMQNSNNVTGWERSQECFAMFIDKALFACKLYERITFISETENQS